MASLALQADATTMLGLERSRDCAVDARERISESCPYSCDERKRRRG